MSIRTSVLALTALLTLTAANVYSSDAGGDDTGNKDSQPLATSASQTPGLCLDAAILPASKERAEDVSGSDKMPQALADYEDAALAAYSLACHASQGSCSKAKRYVAFMERQQVSSSQVLALFNAYLLNNKLPDPKLLGKAPFLSGLSPTKGFCARVADLQALRGQGKSFVGAVYRDLEKVNSEVVRSLAEVHALDLQDDAADATDADGCDCD